MKSLIAFCVGIVACGLIAAYWPATGTTSQTPQHSFRMGWRRTADGWERLMPAEPTGHDMTWCRQLAQLHPLVLATSQILVSLGAIVIGAPVTPRAESRSRRSPNRPHLPVRGQAAKSSPTL